MANLNSERVFDPSLSALSSLDLLSIVLYPRDEAARRGWRSVAVMRLYTEGLTSHGQKTVPIDLAVDIMSLSVSPRRRFEEGMARWKKAVRVAEVLLCSLWAKESGFTHQKLEHWKAWVCERDMVSVVNFNNSFGDFKDASHVAAAILINSTDVNGEEWGRDDPGDSNVPKLMRKVGGYRSYLRFITGKFGGWDLFSMVIYFLLKEQYVEKLMQTAEGLRQMGERQKILKGDRTWKLLNVTPARVELPNPPNKAVNWLNDNFPRESPR